MLLNFNLDFIILTGNIHMHIMCLLNSTGFVHPYFFCIISYFLIISSVYSYVHHALSELFPVTKHFEFIDINSTFK